MKRVRGEDASPCLSKELDREKLRQLMNHPQTELHLTLPDGFIAGWDSTVNTRYGHQEDASVGYTAQTRAQESPSDHLRGGA